MKYEFNEFLDYKERQAKKHLGLIQQVLEANGFRVKEFLENSEDPYIFIYSPKNLSFDGIRVYEIGGQTAFRVQKEAETHPYGKAYTLPIKDMFEDLLGDDEMQEEQIGEELINMILEEIKSFFERSHNAEKSSPAFNDPLGNIISRTTGTDYANQVLSNGDR